MAKPIAIAKGIALAFPDVCKTPGPSGAVPIPYPNVVQLGQADRVTNESGKEVKVGGEYVLLEDAVIETSSGDESGSLGGVRTNVTKGSCKLIQASSSVIYGPKKKGVVRFLDQTQQNRSGDTENAQGVVLSAFPTVLVGD
ncbi:MAG: DUF4150 domain-containing protein [Leptolyngbyaceae cyanobacterium]